MLNFKVGSIKRLVLAIPFVLAYIKGWSKDSLSVSSRQVKFL